MYTESQGYNKMNNKDKRISFLSLFSSLCNLYSREMIPLKYEGQITILHDELAKIAFDLNRNLNLKYPDDGKPEASYNVGTKEEPFLSKQKKWEEINTESFSEHLESIKKD